MKYESMTLSELELSLQAEKSKFDALCKEKLTLDMSRGKPSKEQLDEVMPLLDCVSSEMRMPKGADYRNYGLLDGIPELRELFGQLLGVPSGNVFIGGNSSLNMMYNMIADSMLFGVQGSTPWCKLEKVKFLCPVPGYDRHFNICEKLGIEMISVPMNEDGPDMDLVENLVANDDLIKGIWCVPRFSNPSGIVYSNEVIHRLVSMKPAAKDFRIYYDNAYFIHQLSEDAPVLDNIFKCAEKYGTEDRIYMFASTSKITFAGSGVACVCASDANMVTIKQREGWRIISYNKMWQYAHYMYLQSPKHVEELMAKQAALIKPKFNIVLDALQNNFGDSDLVKWTAPKGGYFICLQLTKGTAKSVWENCKKAGLTITPAGASHPLHQDDSDSYLRIAPTYPSAEELASATDVLMTVIKMVLLEKLVAEKQKATA